MGAGISYVPLCLPLFYTFPSFFLSVSVFIFLPRRQSEELILCMIGREGGREFEGWGKRESNSKGGLWRKTYKDRRKPEEDECWRRMRPGRWGENKKENKKKKKENKKEEEEENWKKTKEGEEPDGGEGGRIKRKKMAECIGWIIRRRWSEMEMED